MRGWQLALGAAAVAMTAVACTTTRGHPEPITDSGSANSAVPAACVVTMGELPSWAQAGFSPPTQSMPFVLGANGNIVAILFGNPLRSPPPPDHNNKILWVSRVARQGDALKIQAKLSGSERVVSKKVDGGPGPSIIDMPAPGCWIFTLSWSGHTDRLAIRYNAS